MTTEAMPAQGPVDVLVGRLRAHAEAHEYIANADPEQKQWMSDLYDAADEIEMLRSWEADAKARADLLEKHLRAVIEVARTWQPDYATKMDRDTLRFAQECADNKVPNAELWRARSASQRTE